MKIVHVVSKYPPSLGGMQKVVETLAALQVHRDMDVSVLTSDEGYHQSGYVDPEPGLSIYRLKSINVAHTPIIFGLFYRLLLLTKRNVVVHLHIAQAFAPEMVWLASKFKGFQYIAHVHIDVAPSGPAGFLLRFYKPIVLKRVLRTARFVVVFSEQQRINMHNEYGVARSKIKVIPNGVEPKFYYPKPRLFRPKLRLIYVGRLGVQKNVQQFLRALDGISDQFETTLVGDGPLEHDLQKLAKDLKLKNVTFAGRADGQKLIDHYKHSDGFVLSSEREGMPLVLLEAMAMALPIIATDVIGTHDVVASGKNGLLVPLNDASALRSALLKISKDKKLYEQMSQNSRHMSEQYAWDKIASQFEQLYEEALHG